MNDLEAAQRQLCRWEILWILDRRRPEYVSRAVILRCLEQKGLRIPMAELNRELQYLKGKELIQIERESARLAGGGVDVIEGNVALPAGIGRPAGATVGEHELARRQEIRWRVMRALDVGRPSAVAESLVWQVLADIDLPATSGEFRRELLYLEENKLLLVADPGKANWLMSLTPLGVDIAEYSVDCPIGIGRPENWGV